MTHDVTACQGCAPAPIEAVDAPEVTLVRSEIEANGLAQLAFGPEQLAEARKMIAEGRYFDLALFLEQTRGRDTKATTD